jgi:hypothetical protein
MPKRRVPSFLALLVGLALAACSQDVPVGEPADMGGNRPDPDGEGEVLEQVEPAGQEVLEGMGAGPLANDSAAAAAVPADTSR